MKKLLFLLLIPSFLFAQGQFGMGFKKPRLTSQGLILTGNLSVGGNATVTGNVAGATYGSDASISNAELLTLDDGALTQILVGGGAGSAPVWTTATGTGAPVRAITPTFTGTPRLGYDVGNYVDIYSSSAGKFIVTPSSGITNFSGGYATKLQNFSDMETGKTAYWLDGTDDEITSSYSALYDVGTADFTIIASFRTNSPATSQSIFAVDKTGANRWDFKINSSQLDFYIQDGVAGVDAAADAATLVAGVNYVGAITVDRDGNATRYLNGDTDGSVLAVSTINGDAHDGATGLAIGSRNAGAFFTGEVSKVYLFNLLLTAAEVRALSNGAPIPYKYIGADQTEYTSGTVTIGKRYRIKTFVAGDDFTNIGGTNVTGNEFTATGATPTTWTNSSILVQIGCVIQLEPDAIASATWFDKSGNNLNHTVSGALDRGRMYPMYGTQHGADDDVGTDDTYVMTLDPAPAALQTGMMVTLTVTTANTGACTLNINGFGAKNIKTVSGADPANSDIVAAGVAMFVYNGTNMILINPATTCD